MKAHRKLDHLPACSEILPASLRRRAITRPAADKIAACSDVPLVFEAVVFVLHTGCQWKAIAAERVWSASAVHRRFLEWQKGGVFEALWSTGPAEYDDLEGMAWRWQSVDDAIMKALLAQEAVGPNSTDRGKKWKQATSAGRRSWRPAVAGRDRGPPT